MNVTDLRKAFASQGIKGFSSANRATFTAAIEAAEIAAYAEDAERTPVAEVAPAAPEKGMCGVCGKRRSYTGKGTGVEDAPRASDLCNFCFTEGGWENAHSDSAHEGILVVAAADRTEDQNLEISGCWICFPDLNLVNREARPGRSRAGMVIVAKGTEIHKSETFRVAAEAAGWTVTMLRETYELEADAEGEGTRYYATATRGEESISLAWDGRKYDYAESGASFAGKGRKVRNLKEALRLL